MLSVAQSIAPLILIIMAGVIAGRTGFVPDNLRKGLSDFCYFFGMPALLLRTIVAAPPSSIEPHLIWTAYLLPVALVWVAGSLLARRHEGAAIAMASSYGNVIMLGIPLSFIQFGPSAATPVALVVLVHSPILFLAAAVHSELTRAPGASNALLPGTIVLASASNVSSSGARRGITSAVRDTSVDLATNPVILAIVAALAMRLAGVQFPEIADRAFSLIGQATLPCVLLAIGLGLVDCKIRGQFGVAVQICILKLVVMPAAAWIVSFHLLELPAAEAGIITLLCAMPTGANAFIFASRSEAAVAPVSAAVALSTILSAITIAVILTLLDRSV